MKRGSAPQYENVKNTFVKYCERMRDQIERIEHDKEWLVILELSRMLSIKVSRKKNRICEMCWPTQESRLLQLFIHILISSRKTLKVRLLQMRRRMDCMLHTDYRL
jgi:hypothetical protein